MATRDEEMFLGGTVSPETQGSGTTGGATMAFSDAPEVVHQPPMDYYGQDKVNAAEALKMEVPKEQGAVPTKMAGPTICGLRRRTFFIILAVAIIVIVGAVAGGVAGGLTANKGSGSDSNSDGSSDGDTSGTGTNGSGSTKTKEATPGETGPTEPEKRAMAASVSSDDNVQLFYQDLDTQDILYRRIKDDKAGDEHTLDLDIKPEWGTQLAAAALIASDPITARVYYTARDDGDKRQVAQAVLECDSDGDSCKTTSNSIISGDISADVFARTRLAALYLKEDFIRVYFQAGAGHIWALTSDDGKKWGQAHITKAYKRTGIVVAAPKEDNIHLFFVSDGSERLRVMIYSDILGAEDDKQVTDSPGSTWSPDVSLTGVHVPGGDPYRIYYAPPDNGDIVSFWQPPKKQSQNLWNRNHNDAWGKVTGGFTSAAWQDQVRMYYFQDSKLVMSAQDNVTWSDVTEL